VFNGLRFQYLQKPEPEPINVERPSTAYNGTSSPAATTASTTPIAGAGRNGIFISYAGYAPDDAIFLIANIITIWEYI
jgi:hypothetical protein